MTAPKKGRHFFVAIGLDAWNNSWGKKLFGTTDLSAGWDGSFAGEECKQDVYVWKVVLSTKSGSEKIFTGEVSLLR